MNIWHGILDKPASSLQCRGELGEALRTLKKKDYVCTNTMINSGVLKLCSQSLRAEYIE